MKKAIYTIILCLLFCSSAFALTFYKGKDAQGNTVYTDQETPNSKPIEVVVPPSAPSAPPPTMSEGEVVNKAPTDYKISIAKPLNDESFTTDIENIVVQINLEPALGPDHRIRLFLNGQQYKEPYNTTSITLDRLNRGAYLLQAQVVMADDPNKAIAQSKAIQFYQRRTLTKVNAPPSH